MVGVVGSNPIVPTRYIHQAPLAGAFWFLRPLVLATTKDIA
jgi:hypothetical protein